MGDQIYTNTPCCNNFFFFFFPSFSKAILRRAELPALYNVVFFLFINFLFLILPWTGRTIVRLPILILYLLKVYSIASGLNLLFLQLELRITTQQYLIYLSLLFPNLLDILQFSQGNFPRTICLLLLTSLFH